MPDIDDLLDEEGMLQDAKLKSFLSGWSADATAVRPMPSPAVSALMRRRHRRTGSRRTGVIITLIVLGSVGAGAGAAAASPEVRQAANQVMGGVFGAIAQAAPAGPAQANPTTPSSGTRETPPPSPTPAVGGKPSGLPDSLVRPGKDGQRAPPAGPLGYLPTDLPTHPTNGPIDPSHGLGRIRVDHGS